MEGCVWECSRNQVNFKTGSYMFILWRRGNEEPNIKRISLNPEVCVYWKRWYLTRAESALRAERVNMTMPSTWNILKVRVKICRVFYLNTWNIAIPPFINTHTHTLPILDEFDWFSHYVPQTNQPISYNDKLPCGSWRKRWNLNPNKQVTLILGVLWTRRIFFFSRIR